MNPQLRLTAKVLDAVLDDLRRPHPFALERVGFLFTKLGNRGTSNPLTFPVDYWPVPDADYVDDDRAGALIGATAIRAVMQKLLDHRTAALGAIHVHFHDHAGPTDLSWTDARELPPLVESFRSVGPLGAHGILILSRDHGLARIWLPGEEQPVDAQRITVVGTPLRSFWRPA